MVLPVGFERTNEKLYEEVNIPVCDRPPDDFCYTPVYINTLDEVCLIASMFTSKVIGHLCC